MGIKEGNLIKMKAEPDFPVRYYLRLGDEEIFLNDLIGKEVRFEYTGQINCISCGKVTKTSFGQGFCYNCLQTAPEASESVMRPELSKAHFGIARDPVWAEEHDLIDHFVYLAASPDLKVGVTRHHQVPVRWIDQGAGSAVILAKTPNRHIAGVMEVWLKQFYSDKTNWRDMLQNKAVDIDLVDRKKEAFNHLTPELKKYYLDENQIINIEYPVLKYPEKIISLSFDKSPVISNVLSGIKGQYLLFDDGSVLNIRRHNGYYVRFST